MFWKKNGPYVSGDDQQLSVLNWQKLERIDGADLFNNHPAGIDSSPETTVAPKVCKWKFLSH